MSKHRAPRNRIHFLIAGCSLALATIFVLLAHYVGHSVITPSVPANVAGPIPTDTPRSDPLQPLIQLEQQRQQAEQAQERAALAQEAADRKAAADAAAVAAAAEEARRAAAEKAAQEAAAKAAAEKAAADAAAAEKAKAATPAPRASGNRRSRLQGICGGEGKCRPVLMPGHPLDARV
jgi:hypothetical protein